MFMKMKSFDIKNDQKMINLERFIVGRLIERGISQEDLERARLKWECDSILQMVVFGIYVVDIGIKYTEGGYKDMHTPHKVDASNWEDLVRDLRGAGYQQIKDLVKESGSKDLLDVIVNACNLFTLNAPGEIHILYDTDYKMMDIQIENDGAYPT